MRIAKVRFDETAALKLYKAGKIDTEIAATLGVNWRYVTAWRSRNKLPSNLKRRKAYERYKCLP